MTDQVSRTDVDAAIAAARIVIAERWGWFLALGIVLLLAGVAAIAFPLSTIAAKIALGWIFLVGGVVLVHAFSIRVARLPDGVADRRLYVVAGGWLAFFPFTGIVTLTILLAALFLAEAPRGDHGGEGAAARGMGGCCSAASSPSPSACSSPTSCRARRPGPSACLGVNLSPPASASSCWRWPDAAHGEAMLLDVRRGSSGISRTRRIRAAARDEAQRGAADADES